jgi:ribosomal protein S27AE
VESKQANLSAEIKSYPKDGAVIHKTSIPNPASFCPNCSAQLKEHRCKLSCPRCGFYLSCSDFY